MRNYIKILTRATLIYAIICGEHIIHGQMKSGLSALQTLISQAATEPLANGILVAVCYIITQKTRRWYKTKKKLVDLGRSCHLSPTKRGKEKW